MIDERDRFMKNSEFVEKIVNKFGFKLNAFDPNWALSKKLTETPITQKEIELSNIININLEKFRIADEFMGRLAIFLGYDWNFEYSDTQLKEQLEYNQKNINDIKYLELNPEYKNSYIKNMAEIQSEIDIRKNLKGD